MRCVKYDTKFADDILLKMKSWKPKPRGKKAEARKKGTSRRTRVSSESSDHEEPKARSGMPVAESRRGTLRRMTRSAGPLAPSVVSHASDDESDVGIRPSSSDDDYRE